MALSTSVPPYIDELLQRQVTTRSLRSTDALRLSVPWTRTETAKRAFCVAAPNVWNSLPNDISQRQFTVNLPCQTENTFLPLRTPHDEHYVPTAAPLYWLLVDIIGAIQIFFYITLHYISWFSVFELCIWTSTPLCIFDLSIDMLLFRLVQEQWTGSDYFEGRTRGKFLWQCASTDLFYVSSSCWLCLS